MKLPSLFIIPKGTRGEPCKHGPCGATIYRVPHPSTGHRQPLRADAFMHYKGENHAMQGAKRPSASEDGAGWNHFIDCPGAHKFHSDARK